ncbi:hypothetical protein B0H19DRAFT_1249514 [Mycena capillaripes]|nr:hypothetical protein B0H19DRAFT_1249514 [Mycena capillaripes]
MHSRMAGKKFYVVMVGHVRGIFTDEAEARDSVSRVSDGTWRKAKTWEHAVSIWDFHCRRYHGNDCLPATLALTSPPSSSARALASPPSLAPGPPLMPATSTEIKLTLSGAVPRSLILMTLSRATQVAADPRSRGIEATSPSATSTVASPSNPTSSSFASRSQALDVRVDVRGAEEAMAGLNIEH